MPSDLSPRPYPSCRIEKGFWNESDMRPTRIESCHRKVKTKFKLVFNNHNRYDTRFLAETVNLRSSKIFYNDSQAGEIYSVTAKKRRQHMIIELLLICHDTNMLTSSGIISRNLALWSLIVKSLRGIAFLFMDSVPFLTFALLLWSRSVHQLLLQLRRYNMERSQAPDVLAKLLPSKVINHKHRWTRHMWRYTYIHFNFPKLLKATKKIVSWLRILLAVQRSSWMASLLMMAMWTDFLTS